MATLAGADRDASPKFLCYSITAERIALEYERVGDDPSRFDAQRVVRLDARPRTPLGPRTVRLRVLAISVEHNALHAARAEPVNIVALRGGSIVPGNSFVAEVAECGDAVSLVNEGDIVMPGDNLTHDRYGFPLRAWAYDEPDSVGCFAQEVVLPEVQLRRVPLDCGLNLWELAALPVKGPSAYHLWRRGIDLFRAKVPRERISALNVLGFGGGVSELFLMLARNEAHRAFYCARNPVRLSRMAARGIEVIDQRSFNGFKTSDDLAAFRREIRARTSGAGMHLVCDMLRGAHFDAALTATARGAVVVSSGWQLGPQLSYNAALLSVRQITLDHAHIETRAGLAAAAHLFGAPLRPLVHDEIYDFSQLPRALQELQEGVHTGIPVVRVASDLPQSVRHLVP